MLISGEVNEVVLLSPKGKEYSRFKVEGLVGEPYALALAPSGERIALLCIEFDKSMKIAEEDFESVRGYVMELKNKEKPKLIFKDKTHVKWVFGRDSESLYGSEIDQVELAKKKTDQWLFKSWKFHLKTALFEPLPLSSDYAIVDAAREDQTFLTKGGSNLMTSSLVSASDWKPKPISKKGTLPYGMSKDGNTIVFHEFDEDNSSGDKTIVLNRAGNIRHDITKTVNSKELIWPAFKCSPNGRRIIFMGMCSENTLESRKQYEIYICDIDGTNCKKIYETTLSKKQSLHQFDWR